MANPPDNSWWTQSQPNPPTPAPPLAALTPIQAPATIAGSLAQRYQRPLPMNPLVSPMGPVMPPPPPIPVPGQFPVFTTAPTLPNATHAVAYSQQLAATGGTTPLVFTTDAKLPAGLTLSSAGLLSGTVANAGGPYTFTVRVKDANGVPGAPVAFSLTVV